MLWITLIVGLSLAAWISYEIHRAPNVEDDNSSLNLNSDDSSWDDNKNHTEGSF